jgi:DNA invertase Pin-like site-specific DNA recombinase
LRTVERRTGAAGTDARREAVVGYVRDVPDGGLDARRQATIITRMCRRLDWELVWLLYESDRTKGRALDRPALGGALRRLAAGEVTCLAVTDLRSLYRSLGELGGVLDALDRAGARLVSLEPAIDTGTPTGRAGARVLGAVSEWERVRSAERSRRGLAAARALRPSIEPELKERIANMRSAGMTLQAIVDELNAAGVPTVRGGSMWRPSSVQAAIGYKRPARAV